MQSQTKQHDSKVGAYFDIFADKHLGKSVANPILTGMRNSFRTYATHPDPKYILDIGCGPGEDIVYFAKKYPSATVYGIDVSANMIACAEEQAKEMGLMNIRFLNVGIENLKEQLPADVRFDLITVFFGALNTVSSLEEAAKTIEGLLASEGRAMLTFVNKYYLSEFFLNIIKGRVGKATARWGNVWHGYSNEVSLSSRTYTPSEIKGAFSQLVLKEQKGYSIFYPAWFQTSWLSRFPRLCQILAKMDKAANKSLFWKFGEYTLFVFEKSTC